MREFAGFLRNLPKTPVRIVFAAGLVSPTEDIVMCMYSGCAMRVCSIPISNYHLL